MAMNRSRARKGARRGFTILELMVAIVVGSGVLLAARGLLGAMAADSERIAESATELDRRANSQRLLRSLVAQVESGTPQLTFGGNASSAEFTTWCSSAGGWLERCRVRLSIEESEAGFSLIAVLSTGEMHELRAEMLHAELRYVADAARGGRWLEEWDAGITAPVALAVVTARDTVLLRIGERG